MQRHEDLRGELAPCLLEPLDADRLRRAQLLREQADAQLLEQPAELVEPRIGDTASLRELARITLFERPQFGHALRIARRVRAQLVEPQRDRLQVARQVGELRPIEQRFWRHLADRRGVRDARLDEFRWLLEELRVSLFAQELRTPQPVSVKRLEKAWAQIAA